MPYKTKTTKCSYAFTDQELIKILADQIGVPVEEVGHVQHPVLGSLSVTTKLVMKDVYHND